MYELTKNFESGISLFYSSRTGSIKRALDQLVKNEYITVSAEEGPRNKRTYTITEEGKKEFERWMLDTELPGNPESAILSRTYFLGLLSEEEREQVGATIRAHIAAALSELETVEAQIRTQEIPQEFKDIAEFQQATLQYGLLAHRSAKAWAEKFLPKN